MSRTRPAHIQPKYPPAIHNIAKHSYATASNNLFSNNFIGIAINPGGLVWASSNTISKNSYGVFTAGSGIFETAGNNAINENLADFTGPITNIATR